MEILTIGEKIKRARVYMGLTLKVVASGIVSISKLSSIENNKIQPEDNIIKYLSIKLNLSEEYLKDDVEKQLSENLNKLNFKKDEDNFLEDVKYNFNFAKYYKHYNLALKFMHLLIEHYLNKDDFKKIENNLMEYNELLRYVNTDENKLKFDFDLGTYYYNLKEYNESVRLFLHIKNIVDFNENPNIYFKALYFITMSYFMLDKELEFLTCISEAINLKIENKLEGKGEYYCILAFDSYGKDEDNYNFYITKANNEFLNENTSKRLPVDLALIMIKYKSYREGLKILQNAYSHYKVINKEFIPLSINLIKVYFDRNIYNEAENIIEGTIDAAIYLNSDYYLEKLYFYKAIILNKQGDIIKSELYMNLSLNCLKNVGGTIDLYKRYIIIAKMYYDIDKYNEAFNYFNLAFKLKEKL